LEDTVVGGYGVTLKVPFRYFPGEVDEHLENIEIAILAVEILAGHLPDTSRELYRWTNFLGCLDQLNYC
jgi:hypothetical protein